MYEYDDLTKNFDDAHEFLHAVDEKLKGDVDFLDHVLRTTRQMEDALAGKDKWPPTSSIGSSNTDSNAKPKT